MSRLYAFGAWLTASMAVALMVLSLVLVPQNSVFADNGPFEPSGCSLNQSVCSNGCVGVGACENNPTKKCDLGTQLQCGACKCIKDPDLVMCRCIFTP
jgi:hypothetical protein